MCCSSPTAEVVAPLGALVADPGSAAALALAGTAYLAGLHRWRRASGHRVVRPAAVCSFVAGLLTAAVAMASPLDTLEATSLSAHMVQHVVLLSIAGPLLALGTPIPTLLWALPPAARSRALTAGRRMARQHDRHLPAWVVGSLAVEAAVMWAWHVPDAYEAAVRNGAVHAAEHTCFLLSSTVAWWSIANGRRSRRGAAAIAALIGSLPGMALGSAMVLAPNPWYPIYVTTSRAAALSDQEVAGVIMWAFGGMAAVIVGAGLFASWLRAAGSARRDAEYRIPPLPVAVGGRR